MNATGEVAKPEPKGTPLTESQSLELIRLRDRLIDLSSRNRSIRLNRLDAKWAFDLSGLNPFGKDWANQIVQAFLKENASRLLLPRLTEENQEHWKKCDSKLKKLDRAVTEIHREKGLYDLFIGFPFISGIPSNSETLFQAPIFLIPVKLERSIEKRGAPNWRLSRPKELPISFNKTLFHALKKLCNFRVNEDIFDEDVPEELHGEKSFVKWASALLNQYGIPNGLDEKAHADEIGPVPEFAMKDAQGKFSPGQLRVCQYAVLGHFPQSNSSVQKDYERFLTSTQEELDGITCFLAEAFRAPDDDTVEVRSDGARERDASSGAAQRESNGDDGVTIDSRPERENFYLLPSDSSQDRILLKLAKPETNGLVVWGPPGTGKSQTIVNIIGDCLYRGKTVLFVSQKRAALDVVFNRLQTKDLAPLTAVVHDSRNDRKPLFEQVSRFLASGLATLQASDPSAEIERITATLKEVHQAYNDSTFGLSLGRLYRELGERAVTLELDERWKKSKYDELAAYANQLAEIQGQARNLSGSRLIRGRSNYASIDNHEKDLIRDGLAALCESARLMDAYTIICKAGPAGDGAIPGSPLVLQLSAFVEEFLSAQKDLESFKGIVRFVHPSYWRAWQRYQGVVRQAEEELETAQGKADELFTRLLKPELASELGRDFASGKIDFREIKALANTFDQQFYDLKALDFVMAKAPAELIPVVDELHRCVEDGAITRNADWGDIFRKSVLTLWVHDLETRHPVISMLRAGQIERLRERYRHLLEEKRNYCARFLLGKTSRLFADPASKEPLKRLSDRVTRHRKIPTIRAVNDEFIGNPIYRNLLPVWLVSPEAVSDILPFQKDLFDVVIFDEASQCPVELALPAVYRGKQIIVAGDEKQLPPSRLFEAQVDDGADDEAGLGPATDEPSFLTLAKRTFRYESCMLEWHYRAHHEELVSFSNQAFYGGRIKIAPNVQPFSKNNVPAISWHSVNGFWEDRTNRAEAAKVLELIRKHLDQDHPPTVGVITFNSNQKDLILDEIDKLKIEDPDFSEFLARDSQRPIDEQLFVKNIENVQGDEREMILFSVAYAPAHPGGRVNQFFGTLNNKGGENRLNVAVTRAIRRIEIVASIDPERDMDTSMAVNDGPKMLHRYLRFAKAVSDRDMTKVAILLNELNESLKIRPDSGVLTPMSPFEEEVLKALKDLNFEVHTQVGQSGFLIDLAIVHPKNPARYLLGIECDGAMFHSSVSARERDVFRQRFLEKRGWRIHRIWSSNWWMSREKEIKRVRELVDALSKEPPLN